MMKRRRCTRTKPCIQLSPAGFSLPRYEPLLCPIVVLFCLFVTVRNSSCGKVMCSHARVKNSLRGGACVAGGSMCGRGAYVAGEMATAADGKHPTGMHSFFFFQFLYCIHGFPFASFVNFRSEFFYESRVYYCSRYLQ